MYIKPKEIALEALYKILLGSVLPRPIAWVSSRSKEGVDNLAPFSFFNVVSNKPPILVFSPGLKTIRTESGIQTQAKDTLTNIKETGEFVVNVVSRNLAELMNQTSANYPPELSEFDAVGLSRAASQLVAAPRVADSLIGFECKLREVIEFGTEPGAGNLVLGEIVCIFLDERVYKNGEIDIDVLEPIGRLGGLSYCSTKERFDIQRPKY